MPAFFTCVSKKFFVLQNCAAPENELFLRQNVPEKGSNTDVLQALRVHYRGKRAVSQAIYPYRASAYPRCTKGNMPAAAKMSAGCVLVLGGRLSPPSSCGLASPDFCPPAGPAEFFGSKNAPATRITPPCGVSAPKNHIALCTPRVVNNRINIIHLNL